MTIYNRMKYLQLTHKIVVVKMGIIALVLMFGILISTKMNIRQRWDRPDLLVLKYLKVGDLMGQILSDIIQIFGEVMLYQEQLMVIPAVLQDD